MATGNRALDASGEDHYADDRGPGSDGRQGAAETVSRHGGRYLAVAPSPEVLEGDPHLVSPVLIEFPDLAAAQRWYSSEDYAPWKQLRHRACENTAIIF